MVNSNYVFELLDNGQLTGARYDVHMTRVVGLGEVFWEPYITYER